LGVYPTCRPKIADPEVLTYLKAREAWSGSRSAGMGEAERQIGEDHLDRVRAGAHQPFVQQAIQGDYQGKQKERQQEHLL